MKKSKKAEAAAEESAGPAAAVRVVSLAALDDLCRKEVQVKVPAPGGGMIEVTCRRLTPAETQKIADLKREPVPKRLPVSAGEDPKLVQYDHDDPEYQRKVVLATRRSRALTVYLGCPMVRAAHPDLESIDQIQAAVESRLTDTLLNLLSEAIVSADSTLEQVVDFFTGPSRASSGSGNRGTTA